METIFFFLYFCPIVASSYANNDSRWAVSDRAWLNIVVDQEDIIHPYTNIF